MSRRPHLHLVTDGRLPYARLLEALHAAAENGVDWIQVRDHRASARGLYDLTCAALAICRPLSVSVAVNDRIDVALAARADGVQLGRRSLPLPVARTLSGALRLGVSVHSLDEALQAQAKGADWITLGHVFPTDSHPDEPPCGVAQVAQVVSALHIPVIAIGGIALQNVAAVLEAGAGGVAVISAILNAAQPAQATAELRRALDAPLGTIPAPRLPDAP